MPEPRLRRRASLSFSQEAGAFVTLYLDAEPANQSTNAELAQAHTHTQLHTALAAVGQRKRVPVDRQVDSLLSLQIDRAR